MEDEHVSVILLFPCVYLSPRLHQEFENGGFILRTHQMFSVHTSPEECKNGCD